MADISPETVSTAALAYLGDSVTELWVRCRLVSSGISNAGKLNELALGYVRATAQSAALKRVLPHFTEEEAAVFRRGKNIDHHSMPKSASQKEYREATGFETVFGYLYLAGRNERIDELLSLAYPEENK
ncbi:MAG: ribonuclease III [Clostridia bacterium]|nr:ribonuclease III [Clostridia bacterium]